MNKFVDSMATQLDMETEKPRLTKNSDNDPLFSHSEFEGYYVDEVNGAGAKEIAAFIPTHHELVQIVKYWYGRVLDNDWFRFQYGGSDSTELRIGRFAPRRIRRAAAAIGHEVVDQAIKEVRDELKAKVSDGHLWEIFERGTAEQCKAVRAESWRQIREQTAAGALERLEQLEKESSSDFIAVVLRGEADGDIPVLISPRASELHALLRASGKFRIETDRSRVRTLIVDQHYTEMGVLRATPQNRGWQFEFPDAEPGRIGWNFLESVADQIKEILRAETGKESTPA